jgi:hypothetical protein
MDSVQWWLKRHSSAVSWDIGIYAERVRIGSLPYLETVTKLFELQERLVSHLSECGPAA